MKIQSAFVFAAIFFVIGVIVVFFMWNALITYRPDLPEGGTLSLPDPYDREAAEFVLTQLANGNFVRELPMFGTLFGIVMLGLSSLCVWLGFVFRGYEKRIAVLEKKNT